MTASHPAPPPRALPPYAIECERVIKRYRTTTALAGVSLQVEEGSVFGFLGPNGAGKSTLVKILTGLVRAGSGTVRVMGGRPGSRPVQRQVGYLPELFRFPGWLSGRELLEFHARLMDVPVDTEALLELTGIREAGERRIEQYSKGMQQRLGLAQALVGGPRLVFLDEPTSALDPLGRLEVRDVLLRLKERGTTVFLNSHLLTEVEKVCDRVAVIDRGVVVTQGTMDELLQAPAARIVVGPLDEAGRARLLQEVPGSTYDGDGELAVPISSRDEVPALVRRVVAAGLPVYEVGLVRHSLEEAFVRLIREHQEAPEPGRGPADGDRRRAPGPPGRPDRGPDPAGDS